MRTQDRSDSEVKGGAPSTGAVGSTQVPFPVGEKACHAVASWQLLGLLSSSACDGDDLTVQLFHPQYHRERKKNSVRSMRAVDELPACSLASRPSILKKDERALGIGSCCSVQRMRDTQLRILIVK